VGQGSLTQSPTAIASRRDIVAIQEQIDDGIETHLYLTD
jgi:hypothetical protein